MKTFSIFLLGTLFIFLSGCSSKHLVPAHSPRTEQQYSTTKFNKGAIKHILNKAYKEWAGVPHKDGGLSKKGIDCSGFVHLIFKQKLKQTVPRTTKTLAKSGSAITQDQLQPGDLVFFKIRWGVHHVGIYIGDGQFIHASKSKGVWRSQLGLKYWQDHYWLSRRVLQ